MVLFGLMVGAVLVSPAAARTPITPYAQSTPLALRSVTPSAVRVPVYGKFEITLNLTATYRNPFDPDQIDVGADFSGPDRRKVHVNGFLYQDFIRSRDAGGNEVLSPAGAPVWKVRFAPPAPGHWTYTVSVRDSSGMAHSSTMTFTAIPSGDAGYVRVSRRNPRAFARDGETPFVPVGENMCWGNGPETYSYEKWIPSLHAAGGNWIRLWMASWSMAIEHAGTGLGVYDLAHAWRLDRTLDITERYRVMSMICLGTYGEFTKGGFFNEGQWDQNPYNSANGGPCATPDDFWTDPAARKLYRQRLRYIAARYGYRTSIQSWELWNETNAPAPWVAEMAQYLKGTGPFAGHPADPFRHLITTTYGNPDVWKIPEIDWTESHYYGVGDVPDLAPSIETYAHSSAGVGADRPAAAFFKPHLMAEFGIDWRKSDSAYDPHGLGIDLHNGIWAGIAGGDAGTAMSWWWDDYIAPRGLVRELTAPSRFVSHVPWTSGCWTDLVFSPITVPVTTHRYGDMVLPTGTAWGVATPGSYTIDAASADDTRTAFPTYLYGPAKPNLQTSPVFHVYYREPGDFVVHVDQVSNHCVLEIIVDGVVGGTFTLNAAPPTAGTPLPYKSTQFEGQYKIYLATFDQDYAVSLPIGRHTVRVAVVDGDWLSVSEYRLTNYRGNEYANAAALGMTDGHTAILWVHNSAHDWKNALDGLTMPTIHSAVTSIEGLSPGRYAVHWFNTETGVFFRTEYEWFWNDGLPLSIPDLTADVAALITPAGRK